LRAGNDGLTGTAGSPSKDSAPTEQSSRGGAIA